MGGDYNSNILIMDAASRITTTKGSMLNVDRASRITTTKGSEIRKAVQETCCRFHTISKSTYWPKDPNKIPYLLDFFISRKISLHFIHIEENSDLDSDHLAVIPTLSERIIKK